MFALDCPTQGYEWGSIAEIPAFLRREPGGQPVAEVWLGTHPSGTARILTDGSTKPLTAVAGDLPFMLKILAADRPLSIQVHPNSTRARSGFEAEEAAGIPIDARNRVFKDPNPKPEMVYALSTFDSLVGFRPTAEILRVLTPLSHPLVRSLADDLRDNPGFAGIVKLVERLTTELPSSDDVDTIIEQCREAFDQGIDIKRAYATAIEISRAQPGDVGVVLSLLMNRLTLQPGEAAFLDAGIIHAHLGGMCLEVMVSSDNVLRAGLTSKHVDPAGLVQCLEEGMSRVARVTPRLFGLSTDVFSPTVDFALSVTQTSLAEPGGVALPERGQRLILCTGGDVELTNDLGDTLPLSRGDAAYADSSDGTIEVTGTGEVCQAYLPSEKASEIHDLV